MANEIVENAGIATVNGENLLGDKLFIDGVFDTVGLDGNKNLQSTEDEPVEAGIVCPRLGTTGSGTVTIDNVRYAGPLYPNITTASTDSSVVAVQGGSFRNAHQDILRDRIGVIDDSWFHNTTAGNRHGAALSLFDGSKTTITGSTFTNNSNTSGNGGAIGGSTASSIDSGGGSELTLQNCFFANNISTGQCGGAIYGSTNSQLTISGSTFTCNTANNYGGVIYATTRVELKISDSVFSGNIVTKGNGGAIHLEREVSATITGSTFSGNTAGVKTAGLGGAITVCFNSSLFVSGCTFAGNIAYNYAGAIFVNSEGQSTTIENCVFATKSDSIVIDTGTVSFSGTITLATDVRKENHPDRGHYLCSTDKVDFDFINEESISIAKLDNAENIRSLSFRSTEMVNFTDLELSDTILNIDCELPSLGQSLSIAGGLTSLGSGTITVHGKNAVGGKAFFEGSLYKVYLSDNFLTITSEEYVRAAIVTSNGAEWIQVGSTNYAGNFYPSIDAALEQEDFVVMQGTFATRSSVTGANKRAVISQTDVTGNAVDVDGGALMISEGFASITASAFSRNVARNGGAIANDEGRLIISGNTFTDNTAMQNGGAIYSATGGTGSVENALFTGNIAREAGGAVYCADAASALSISGSTFTDNAAIQNGGAIYLKDGTVNITDCVFSATSDTIYNDDGVLTLGGTVWTAANITSTNAISVEENTSLVLDLSVYAGTTSKELLTNYNTMFGESQKNLTISINVASDQTFGKYVLAAGVDTLRQTEFTITLDGDTEKSFTVSVGGATEYDSKNYMLQVVGDTLSLDIEIVTDTGIVTKNGDVNSVVIKGVTYSGRAYAEDKINHALADKQIVVAQGVSYTGNQVIVAENKVLVADAISLSGNTATEAPGAIYNSGTATITAGTFTGNEAESGGAFYNSGTATIENSVFVTAADTIYNDDGVLTLGDTVWTAANITSTNAISVEENTSLVLDLSVYAGTTSKELLTNYNTMFGESQKNLTISINVASDQTFGKYVLAAGVDTLRQTEFTITLDGDTEKSFTVSVGGGMVYGSNYYSLKLADGTLSLTIQGQSDVGVVTFDGGTDTVVIAGATYTGKAYRQEDIGQALDQKQIVAAQDVTLSGFTVSSGQTFVGDNITMSETSAAIYNEGTMTLSGTITTGANITSTKAFNVEGDTQLVLDFSARTADMGEMLTDYNTSFSEMQSNLSITINADQEQSTGVYTLATNATKIDCPITFDINNEFVAPLDFVTKVISGKRVYRLDWNNLDIQFIVKDVSDGKIFGGDTILSEDTAVSEVARLNIKEGSFVAAAGGVYATNCRVDINTDTNVSVENGYFSNIVCAGSIVNENVVLTVNDASRLTISGGTFANAVAGGNYIQSASGTVYGGRSSKSNTYVNITGGTFQRDVFGGNIAAKNSFATTTNSYITGSTHITIDTSENVVSISGNLVAGSSGVGQIIGSTNLTFKGTSDNLLFGNKSIVCGDSHDATTAVSCVGSAKTVSRFLNFDDFTGTLDAKVVGFDQVNLSGGSVTLAKSSRLSDVSSWNFSGGAILTFENADNNFRGDTLTFGTFDGNEWTVVSGSDSTLANWDWADQVTIAGQNASFDESLGYWTSADYKFYKEDNALKVAKLA